nr:MAG TPA: capsid protein [Caudoviricetes sp.]
MESHKYTSTLSSLHKLVSSEIKYIHVFGTCRLKILSLPV